MDFVGKSYQLGKYLEHLTHCLPSGDYKCQQLIHMNKMSILLHPYMQQHIADVCQFSKCKMTRAGDDTQSVALKRVSQMGLRA